MLTVIVAGILSYVIAKMDGIGGKREWAWFVVEDIDKLRLMN